MRLIDADRLELVFEKNVASADIFEPLIDIQPTVDAIPVEWLKENFPISEVYGTENYFRNAYAVQRVLKLWEKEKEKRGKK